MSIINQGLRVAVFTSSLCLKDALSVLMWLPGIPSLLCPILMVFQYAHHWFVLISERVDRLGRQLVDFI